MNDPMPAEQDKLPGNPKRHSVTREIVYWMLLAATYPAMAAILAITSATVQFDNPGTVHGQRMTSAIVHLAHPSWVQRLEVAAPWLWTLLAVAIAIPLVRQALHTDVHKGRFFPGEVTTKLSIWGLGCILVAIGVRWLASKALSDAYGVGVQFEGDAMTSVWPIVYVVAIALGILLWSSRKALDEIF